MSSIVLLCGIVSLPARADTTVDARHAAVVMFAPPEAEIRTLTDRDISVQDFLAYWIEIRRRLGSEMPALTVIESDAETIAFGDRLVSRRKSARGFGLILYTPERGPRVLDGVIEPDDCLRKVHEYFDASPLPRPPLPSSVPVSPVPPAPETTVPTPVPKFVPPASLVSGTWRGSVTQYRAQPYSVVMDLHSGGVGTRVGTVSYPELACRGSVKLLTAAPTSVLLVERIDSGPCVGGGTIALITSGPRAGDWKWYDDVGHQQASAKLTRIVDPSQSMSQPSRLIGTVRKIARSQQMLVISPDDDPEKLASVSSWAMTRYRGFGGLLDGQPATKGDADGFDGVHVGDRVDVEGADVGGTFMANNVTLLGRSMPAAPPSRKTGHGGCSDFKDAGTLPFAKKFYLTMEVFGVDRGRLMGALASRTWFPHNIRILSVNESTGIARAESDWVPGAQAADDGRPYAIVFRVQLTPEGAKLSMEVDLLAGQFSTNRNAKALMCETLTMIVSGIDQS